MDLGNIMDTVSSGKSGDGGLGSVLDLVGGEKGGLNSITDMFSNNGMGDLVNSWIGKGENKSVDAGQIEKVLGAEKIQKLANKNGIDFGSAAGLIAQFLPMIIDKITPDGILPSGDGFNLDMLKKFF